MIDDGPPASPAGSADAALQFGAAFVFLASLGAVARWGAGLVGRLVDSPDDELLTVCFVGVGVAVLVAGVAEEQAAPHGTARKAVDDAAEVPS